MIKKDGKYFIIDKIDDYRFIEVIFKGEEERPLYKIYYKKECVDKWRSPDDLHSMDDFQIADSPDYQIFLDFVQEDSDEILDYDDFGLPERSSLGIISHAVNKPDDYDDYPTYSYAPVSNYKSIYKPIEKKKGFYNDFTKSNTLVFHKTDSSTTMLSQIYEGKGWDVLHSCYDLDEEELFKVVDAHERIVCLGHGYGGGLMGMFGKEMAPHFKDKKLFIIWCNADVYFTTNNIGDGYFITGNMPSEVGESIAAGCGNISKEEMLNNITYWSKLCADVVEKCLEGDVVSSVKYIRENYIKEYGTHPVTRYNSIRTKMQGTTMEQNEKEVDEIYQRLGVEIKSVEEIRYHYFDEKQDNEKDVEDTTQN